MTFRLGLTGGLASGKSTVARRLAERGCRVVDADRLVAELYAPGEPGAEAVEELFGGEYLDDSGAVDRARVAQRVFRDDLARRRLEGALWPLVGERFEEIVERADEGEIVVLEATLLAEAGFAPAFELVVTVEAPPKVRLERAVERGMERDEAEARLRAQGDGDVRRQVADVVIHNDGTLEELHREVDGLLMEIRSGKFGGGLGRRREGRRFVLVTGNRHKVREAERILGRAVDFHAADLPEIQSLDLLAVLQAKAAAAWEELGRPLVVEESGLELAAMNGFPGPLVKWMLEAVGAEGLARAAHVLGDDRATARCALLYKHGPSGADEVVAEGRVEGRLVLPPRGDGGFGWDPVFVPEGGEATAAELDGEAKDAVSHRGRAWRRLAAEL